MKSRAIGLGLIRQASATIAASRTHAAKARPSARPASRRRRILESVEEDDDPLAIVVLDSRLVTCTRKIEDPHGVDDDGDEYSEAFSARS